MKIKNYNYFKKLTESVIGLIIFGLVFCLPSLVWAMEPGTLIYRTSGGGQMYGYNNNFLIYAEKGIVKNVYSGHVGIYVGQENGVDYVVEALSDGIVKTPAQYFINEANGEKLLGAKIPKNLTPLQQIKIVELAKSLANKKLKYDLDFKKQKGPDSGEWTCVGLTEKIYESANISNPNNLGSLEYDQNYYAIDITPDGFDNYSLINDSGDCFSKDKEFSKIYRQTDLLIPAPELIGYDVGLEYNQERYIFLPYTQFLQPTLKDVPVDITLSSSFSDPAVRGETSKLALVFRWSLINNPLSTIKNLALKAKNLALNLKDKIFNKKTGTEIVLGEQDLIPEIKDNSELKTNKTTAKKLIAEKNSEKNLPEAADPKIPAPLITVRKSVTSPLNASSSSSDTSKKNINLKNSSKPIENKIQSAVGTSSSKIVNDKKLISKSALIASSTVVKTGTATTSSKSKIMASGANSGSRARSGSSTNSQTTTQPKLAIINKIYSSGGNHWVELYNPNNYDFDLAAAGYRLEKTKTAADPTLIMRLGDPSDGAYPGGTIIKAKGTYLIVKASANDYFRSQAQALATRDDFFWGSSGYTLYLGTDTISSSADPDIVDAVGFGTEATYFRGPDPASAITENYILNRIANLGSNKNDFNLIPSTDPGISWSTSTVSSNLETSISTSTASSTAMSTTTASTTASTTSPVATTTPIETSTSTSMTASTTEQINTTTPPEATTTSTAACPKNLLINKIYSTDSNDWLELFNPGDDDVDLAASECRLEKNKTAQDPDIILRFGNLDDGYYPGGTVIKAHDKYLIVRDEANDYFRNQAEAIATRTEFFWDGSGYTIYLGGGAISSSTDEDIIDYVGFGPEAIYYQGPGAALAITDNYVLNRIFSTKANYFDFSLVQSDDPGIIWSENTSTLPIISTSTSALPTSLFSPGLTDLWHFDECHGTGRYQVGKWDCAWSLGAGYPVFNESSKQNLDFNNGTISFYYRKDFDYPALDFQLKDLSGQTLRILLNQGMLQLEGLPNSQWRYFDNYFNDDQWHQAVLSVNQASGTWSFYLDGVEKIKQNFLASLPREFKDITVTGYSTLIDEIAIWNRFLSSSEVENNYQTQLPFAPLANRLPQEAPVLKHYWDFQEAQVKPILSLEAVDFIGGSTLILPNTDIWTWRALNNSAIINRWSRDLSVNFEEPLTSKDLSLGFWWHNASYPENSRMSIGLKNSNGEELMTLIPTSFRPTYRFNYTSGFFGDGLGTIIPNDGEWHYLTMTYNSYNYELRLYVDGVEKASVLQVWFRDGNSPVSLEIKNEIGIVEIDDLGVWEGTLSEQQIQNIFANNK